MIVLHAADEFKADASVLALGMFDGVHIGHQKLIRTAVRLGREEGMASVVCTFDRHPISLLCPKRAPEPLLSLQENLRKFEKLGADAALVQAFTAEFADLPPEEYLEALVRGLKAKILVIGENHTFGRGGKGNAQLVQKCASRYGYRAVTVGAVCDQEGVVSSTRIRRMLQEGEIERARVLLDIEGEGCE